MYKWKYRLAKSKTNPTKARRGFDKITKMLSTKNRDPSIVHCSMLCDVLPINQKMVQSICEKKTFWIYLYWAICSRHSHYHTSAGNVIQIRGSLYSGGNSKFVMHVHLKVLFWWNLQFRLSRRRTLENEIPLPGIKDHFNFYKLICQVL